MAADHNYGSEAVAVATAVTGEAWRDSRDFADAEFAESKAAQFEPTKLFVHADRILNWVRGELPAPVTLELDLTLVCNDRCPYCPHGFAHQGRCLELDSIGRILDEAASLGIRGLTVTGGGEPLMHPKFRDIVRLIRTYPFAAGIITNGGRINSETASEMVATFQWIRVSLDAASEASFQRIRGRRGMAERLKRISLLAAARQEVYGSDCELGASFLTCSQTADEIVEAAQIAQDLGFDYIQFKPMVNWVGVNKHASPLMDQDGVFGEVELATRLQSQAFKVLVSSHRYEAEMRGVRRSYSAFHCAWFIAAVGPNASGSEIMPTLYLDCSSKYVPLWTIGEFRSLEDILRSARRRHIISIASCESYCVPSEKHAVYNTLLEKMLLRSQSGALSQDEIRAWSPRNVRHPYSL